MDFGLARTNVAAAGDTGGVRITINLGNSPADARVIEAQPYEALPEPA